MTGRGVVSVYLVPLTAANSYLCAGLELTSGADPWVAEVEQAAVGELASNALLGSGDNVYFARDAADRLVGVGVVGTDQRWPFATCLRAMVIDHRFRGSGYHRELLIELKAAAESLGR